MTLYTVLGVWPDEQPVSVGVIVGEHEVHGGDDSAFDVGLWAISVESTGVDEAQDLAAEDCLTQRRDDEE
ncbi:hypothetical protein [Plantactinospora sp. CA-290183]|uniref:hypothetical protein n=1 Tax=Plantactinospora sp. CA-290183 TaxID=3240006 RepID=UPI003D8B5FCB